MPLSLSLSFLKSWLTFDDIFINYDRRIYLHSAPYMRRFECSFSFFAQIIFKWRVFMFVQIKVALGVCFVLNSWKEYLLLFTYLMTLGKVVTFPLITTFKTNMPPNYLFVEYRIKMWPHRLIHAINKPVLNLYFRFEFFIRKLDNSLCTSLIIRLTCILMINLHKKCD